MTSGASKFKVDRPERQARVQVLIRLVVLLALGSLGLAHFYWFIYLGIPAIVAVIVSQKGGARYVGENGLAMSATLRWLAAAVAYLGLLTDEIPGTEPSRVVHFTPELYGAPTPGEAVARVVFTIPALFILGVLSCLSGVFWIIAALSLLVRERTPGWAVDFIEFVLRYKLRIVVYHFSLTDRYPSLG